MDIRELRIGDIVTTNGKPKGTKKGNYYRVIEIDSKNRLKNLIGSAIIESAIDKRIGQVCAWVDYLKPIPLTDVLITKMGFKNIAVGDYHLTVCDSGILLSKALSYYRLAITEYSSCIEYTSKLIKNLYELQHELYDAGIELKIEL